MEFRSAACGAASLSVLWLAGVACGQPVRVDGVASEWVASDALSPEAGGSSGVFTVSSVSARSAGTRLYLRFDTGVTTNLQAGDPGEGTLVLDIRRTEPSAQRALAVDFRARTLYRDGDPGEVVTWAEAGIFVQPTYAASEYEFVLDLACVGIAQGETIAITFGDGGVGEDAAQYVLDEPFAAPAERSHERPPGTRLRIASINTLQTGLFDPRQRDELARLIDAVDAEVYCVQEEYGSQASQIATLLATIDPLEDGAAWNVHKNNDCVVASTLPLVPLPSLNSKYAAAAVDLGGGEGVIVFSVHPKCCGHRGSSEDAQRIWETEAMIAALADVRSGGAGAALAPFADAPAVVIGDWNLVGSRTPLDLVEDPAGPDLRDVLIGPLVGRDVHTWRGASTGPGSFMPGRLDLAAVQREGLAVSNAFTLDTRVLGADDLAALGLQADDSGASDHLMLVTDLAFPEGLCPGDIDGSGSVNVLDFGLLAESYGSGPGLTRSEGDLTGDGYVDVFDFGAFVGAFGGACP